jgi:hypothetical protein
MAAAVGQSRLGYASGLEGSDGTGLVGCGVGTDKEGGAAAAGRAAVGPAARAAARKAAADAHRARVAAEKEMAAEKELARRAEGRTAEHADEGHIVEEGDTGDTPEASEPRTWQREDLEEWLAMPEQVCCHASHGVGRPPLSRALVSLCGSRGPYFELGTLKIEQY